MRWIIGFLLIAGIAAVAWAVVSRLNEAAEAAPRQDRGAPAPVSAAAIERGRIELRRVYAGTLEARARFVVAPKVAGRIESLAVDLADTVRRGQVVAVLDDAEFVQAVEQAKADVAVAEATVTEAVNAVEIAGREMERIVSLRERGVASEAQLDVVRAEQSAKAAALQVARAQAERAKAALESTNIRLGYTRVTANWPDADTERIVAERHVDAGGTVSANAPLMTIVDLAPINGVIYATERDYARLRVGQDVKLTTDAYSGRDFAGRIRRVAPVFREASRQARIELEVDNEDHTLKPGMFIRARVTLATVDDATIVPVDALTIRDGVEGVFIVSEDGASVKWRPVTAGIRDGGRVQVTGDGLVGRVVTLGQQLIGDGSAITIPDDGAEAEAAPAAAPPAEPEAPR